MLRIPLIFLLIAAVASPAAAAGLNTMVLGGDILELSGARQITDPLSDGAVISSGVSPDGASIVFIAQMKDTTNLCIVPASGGQAGKLMTTPREVEAVKAAASEAENAGWFLRPTDVRWSTDAKSFALTMDKRVAEKDSAVTRDNVVVYGIDGKVRNSFAVPADFRSTTSAVFSPDGTKLAVAVGSTKAPQVNLNIYDLQKNSTHTLKTDTYTEFGRWAEDGNSVFYWSLRRGEQAAEDVLRQVSLVDDTEKVVGSPSSGRAMLSPDGTLCAVSRQDGLSVQDVASGASKQLSKRKWPMLLGWSPDGKMIAFTEGQNVTDQDGGRSRQINTFWVSSAEPRKANSLLIALDADRENVPSWSADGSRIAYISEGSVYIARFTRRQPQTEEKLAMQLPLTEAETKTILERNGLSISDAFGQFLLDQQRLPTSPDELQRYAAGDIFSKPGKSEMAFQFRARPGTPINQVSSDTVLGVLDGGYKWKIAIRLGGKIETVQE